MSNVINEFNLFYFENFVKFYKLVWYNFFGGLKFSFRNF